MNFGNFSVQGKDLVKYNPKSSAYCVSSTQKSSGSMAQSRGGVTIPKNCNVPMRFKEKIQKKTTATPRKFVTTETCTRTLNINPRPAPAKKSGASCSKTKVTAVKRKRKTCTKVTKKARVEEEYSSEYSSEESFSEESCSSDYSSDG